MKDFWTALISLFKEVLAPFLSGWMISDATNKAKINQEKADALEARIKVGNTVDAMSDADVSRMLDTEWDNPKQRHKV